jgi:xanthine dehydrogenase YagS FAD-binding subunit
MSRSEVPKFALLEPTSVSDAISMVSQYSQDKARFVSGGTDMITRMKNRIASQMPSYLVDISQLPLSYINSNGNGGLNIGGTTPITTVVDNSTVQSDFSVLSQAANSIATLQIRNTATIAGDVLQEVWCPYFRNNFDCWRNLGNTCYGAIGDNRYYHSIFGGRLCYAVHAGDAAPALTALGATATIQGPLGTRTVTMDDLIPGINIINGRVQENTVAYNEILTEFQIPAQPSGTVSTYYKVRDRGTWDFALASAAVVLHMSGSTVSNATVVLGGVDVKPHRAPAAESALNGQTLTPSVISNAGNAAVQDATPLSNAYYDNAYRVQIANGAVVSALNSLVPS